MLEYPQRVCLSSPAAPKQDLVIRRVELRKHARIDERLIQLRSIKIALGPMQDLPDRALQANAQGTAALRHEKSPGTNSSGLERLAAAQSAAA
jgi:hypothetical protein